VYFVPHGRDLRDPRLELVRPGGELPDHRAGPLSPGAPGKPIRVAAPEAGRQSEHAGSRAGGSRPAAAGAWGDALDPARDGRPLWGIAQTLPRTACTAGAKPGVGEQGRSSFAGGGLYRGTAGRRLSSARPAEAAVRVAGRISL